MGDCVWGRCPGASSWSGGKVVNQPNLFCFHRARVVALKDELISYSYEICSRQTKETRQHFQLTIFILICIYRNLYVKIYVCIYCLARLSLDLFGLNQSHTWNPEYISFLLRPGAFSFGSCTDKIKNKKMRTLQSGFTYYKILIQAVYICKWAGIYSPYLFGIGFSIRIYIPSFQFSSFNRRNLQWHNAEIAN